MGLSTRAHVNTLNPAAAPNSPTQITMAADKAGMPPKVLVTSMAMGVVTDLAANETMTSCEAPRYLATSDTDMMPTVQPANWLRRMGRICLRMDSSCR